jgi:hypothetical protein
MPKMRRTTPLMNIEGKKFYQADEISRKSKKFYINNNNKNYISYKSQYVFEEMMDRMFENRQVVVFIINDDEYTLYITNTIFNLNPYYNVFNTEEDIKEGIIDINILYQKIQHYWSKYLEVYIYGNNIPIELGKLLNVEKKEENTTLTLKNNGSIKIKKKIEVKILDTKKLKKIANESKKTLDSNIRTQRIGIFSFLIIVNILMSIGVGYVIKNSNLNHKKLITKAKADTKAKVRATKKKNIENEALKKVLESKNQNIYINKSIFLDKKSHEELLNKYKKEKSNIIIRTESILNKYKEAKINKIIFKEINVENGELIK